MLPDLPQEPNIEMKIEEKLALGTLVLRIIFAQSGDEMAPSLREVGEGVTTVNGEALVGWREKENRNYFKNAAIKSQLLTKS